MEKLHQPPAGSTPHPAPLQLRHCSEGGLSSSSCRAGALTCLCFLVFLFILFNSDEIKKLAINVAKS